MYQELKTEQLKIQEENKKFQEETNRQLADMRAMFEQIMTGFSAIQQTMNANNQKENERLKLQIAQKG